MRCNGTESDVPPEKDQGWGTVGIPRIPKIPVTVGKTRPSYSSPRLACSVYTFSVLLYLGTTLHNIRSDPRGCFLQTEEEDDA